MDTLTHTCEMMGLRSIFRKMDTVIHIFESSCRHNSWVDISSRKISFHFRRRSQMQGRISIRMTYFKAGHRNPDPKGIPGHNPRLKNPRIEFLNRPACILECLGLCKSSSFHSVPKDSRARMFLSNCLHKILSYLFMGIHSRRF